MAFGSAATNQFGLAVATTNVASTTVASGATLDFNDNTGGGIKNLQGAGTVIAGTSAATELKIGTGNFSGGIQGAGNLHLTTVGGLAGPLTLSGTNTYTGVTTVDAGQTPSLVAGGKITATASVTNSGTINVGDGAAASAS